MSQTEPPNAAALRIKAIETLLYEKGVLLPGAVDEIVDVVQTRFGPRNGARVVARAWSDPEYKARLLDDGTAAVAELGFSGFDGNHLAVLENTDKVHHLVVCTLCSCYPWPVLGLPPAWYKSPAYRSRAVSEPRAVLAEFGLDVPTDKEIHVYDSLSELRYMVLPERPTGTEGWSEEQLAELVTRDSMIGTGLAAEALDKIGAAR